MPVQGGDIIWRITADGAQLAQGLKSASLSVATFTQSIVNIGRIAGAAFRGLESILVSPFESAISSAMSFGTAMAEVSTLGVKDIGSLGDEIKDISTTFGIDLVDGAKAAYQAISAGASAADTPLLLAKAAEAATAGTSDLTTAIELGMSVTNAFGRSISEVGQAYDEAFIAAKAGVTTFNELAGSVGQLSPAFVAAGMSSGEMFAAIAALTKGGIQTSIAVTDLKAVVAAFQRQGDTAALQTLGLKGAMELLREETAGNDQAMLKYLGSTEAMTAVLALTGSQATSFGDILGQMKDSTGAATEAFDAFTANDPAFVWRQLKQEAHGVMVELGEALLPTLGAVGEKFLLVSNQVRVWISANKETMASAVEQSGAIKMILEALGWLEENWTAVIDILTIGAKAAWEAVKMFGSIVETVLIGASTIIVGFVSGTANSFSNLVSDTDLKSMSWNEKLNFFLTAARDVFSSINIWLQETAIPWLKENWQEIVADVSDFYENVAKPLGEFASAVIGAVESVMPYLDNLAWILGKISEFAWASTPVAQLAGLGEAMGGGRSKGGLVLKNQTYTVGEAGGEVFFPQDHGMPLGIGLSGRTRWRAPDMGHVLNHEGVNDLIGSMPVGPKGTYNVFTKKNWMPGIIRALISNKVPASFAEDVWNKHTYVYGLLKAAQARAMGGAVFAASPYIVGEKGPELFVPSEDGTIIPNDKLGRGGIIINITADTINMRNREEAEQLSQQLAASVKLKLAASGWA